MKNAPEKISSRILMFSIVCFMQCSALLVGFVTGVSKQDSWFCVITGFIVSLPILLIFVILSEKFPGKSIIQINDIIFGKVLGKIFSTMYVFYFLYLSCVNSKSMSSFVIGSIMPETPEYAILFLFILACAYAIRKGLETTTRYSVIIAIVVSLVLIINTILLIKDMKLTNFQPFLSLPIKNYIQATHEIAILPFSDIIVFSMLFPNIKNPQRLKKPMFGGLTIGALIMLLVISRDIAVLGPVIGHVTNPSFNAVRLIDISETMTRMEILYALTLLVLFYFKISILFYAVVKGLSQIFGLESYKQFVPVVGALIISFSIIVFSSAFEMAFFAINIAPIFQTFIEVILPAITLIVAVFRGFKKPKPVNL